MLGHRASGGHTGHPASSAWQYLAKVMCGETWKSCVQGGGVSSYILLLPGSMTSGSSGYLQVIVWVCE
jgi:hypothetical protein